MKASWHIAQGICLAPVAYYFTDLRTAAIFGGSVVLIDIDHYLHYVFRRKNFSIRGMFSFYDDVWDRRKEVFGIEILHTAEVLLLFAALGLWHPAFLAVAAGFFVHILFDFLHLSWHRVPFVRALSFIEFSFRRKNYSAGLIW